jgi:AraC family transcriptional regulator, transcriptional activator of pobA
MDQLFTIFKINEEDVKRILSTVNEPHFHDYEELIVGMEGKLDHFIDFKTSVIESPLISFVAKGKIHKVIPNLSNGRCSMWVIRFKSEFIPETTFQLYSYYHNHANIQLESGQCYNRLVQVCQMMSDEMQQSTPDLGIVRHLLSALFTMIESERKKIAADPESINKTQNITFKNFLKILEDNYMRPEGVEFYAEKLFMSSRNLNIICKNILNRSVSEIIETRKLIEAKNQLINTDKTVAEIGFELGFNEKAYFTNVFKRKSGQTPTEFREEMKKQLS